MLICDLHAIGNNLYKVRKHAGLTRAEVAEKAGISERAYADIERGNVTMRIDSLLKICKALRISPNDILIDDSSKVAEQKLLNELSMCSDSEKETVLKLLSIYINSL